MEPIALGDDLFANCLIALNAESGERIWHFQGVKHDLWDRDFPAPPVLLTVQHDGKKVDAVAQTTKQGFVFLFDRANGKPLFPLECRNYPASDVPGEVAANQQCLPAKPVPFARQLLTEDMLSQRTPEVHQWALEKFRGFRSEGQFVPFSVGKDTVVFPGFDGGAEWGGAAADPETGILYVNANDLAWTGALAENTSENTPKALYLSQCAVCHGEHMAGSPPSIPSLVGIGQRRSPQEIAAIVKSGRGRMPGFANLRRRSVLGAYVVSQDGRKQRIVSSGPRVDRNQIPLHRLPPFSRPRWISRSCAAVGDFERDQSQYRRIPVEDSAGRVSRTRRSGPQEYWHRELWRANSYSRRIAFHWSHQLR